jgi:hypothetical protein
MQVAVGYITQQLHRKRMPGKKIAGRWYIPRTFVEKFRRTRRRPGQRLFMAFVELDGTRLHWRFASRKAFERWLTKAAAWARDGWVAGIEDPQKLSQTEINNAMRWESS